MRKMGLPAIKDEEHWTYAHYKTWPDDERWELIHGVAYNMSPTPSPNHQRVLVYLVREIGTFLEGKPCELFAAPFDVFLPDGNEDEDQIDTIVQPDVLVICDRNKIDGKGSKGAPDLAVEIISPWTSRKDIAIKFDLYQEKGVREYWVIDPGARSLHRYIRGENGSFGQETVFVVDAPKPGPFVDSEVLKGFRLDLTDCFARLD